MTKIIANGCVRFEAFMETATAARYMDRHMKEAVEIRHHRYGIRPKAVTNMLHQSWAVSNKHSVIHARER
jgi:hypothetical protein